MRVASAAEFRERAGRLLLADEVRHSIPLGVLRPSIAAGAMPPRSLVAAWTSELLRRGARRCALFTDLANPTSNSIYQAVGYRPVGDAAVIDLL